MITAALVTAGIVSYVKSSEMIQNGIIGVTEQIIKKTMANVDFYLRDTENLSKVIAVDERVQKAMKSQFDRNNFNSDIIITNISDPLMSFRNTRIDVTRVMVVNQSGYILDKELVNSSEDLWESGWFKNYSVDRSNLKFVGVHDSLYKWTGVRVLTCIKRVYDMSNPSLEIGHILIDLDYSILSRIFGDLKLPNRGSFYLYDDDGLLVYKNEVEDISDVVKKNYDLMNKDSGNFIVDYKGKRYELIYAKSDYSSWRLVGVISYRELMKNAVFQRNTSFLVILLCLLISIVISSIVVSNTYRPLLKLVGAMKKVEDGDFDTRVYINTGDEMDHLGKGFNQMVQKLQDLISRVYREEQMKKEAELNALQAQVNPHFLYNTLNSIRFLAKKHDVSDIRNITNSLINLCRSCIESGRKFITLQQELELVSHYINIQKLRYGDVFVFKYNIQPHLNKCLIPRFSVQPLVENALFHGLMTAGGGTISVDVAERGKVVEITVEDDGSGIDEDIYSVIIANINEPCADVFRNKGLNSIGIKNISDRVKLYFGEEYGLCITSSKGNGTKVVLKIPRIDTLPEEVDKYDVEENSDS